jgi:hypothetical protein
VVGGGGDAVDGGGAVLPAGQQAGRSRRRPHRDREAHWFPDHPLNGQDRLFNVLPPAAQQMLTCKLARPSGNMEPDAKVAIFNIVVTNG